MREHGTTLIGQEQRRGFLIRRAKEDRPFSGKAEASGLDMKRAQRFRNGGLIGSPLKGAKRGSGKATVQKQIAPHLARLFSQYFRQRVNSHARGSQAAGTGTTEHEVKISRWTGKAPMPDEIDQHIACCLIRCFERLCPLFEEGAEQFQLI